MLDNWRAKASQEVTCRVKVPMEALMSGTSSRTARVSAVRRNLKEAAGKLPARGTRTAYEALSRWTRGPIDSKSNDIRIEAAYMRRVGGRKVTRLTLRDLSRCLFEDTSGQSRGFERNRLSWQKSAEAIVSRRLTASLFLVGTISCRPRAELFKC